MTKTIILIPSRLSATRLPNKPLLKINNLSIVNHVYQKAKSIGIGEVYVATGDKEIFQEKFYLIIKKISIIILEYMCIKFQYYKNL